MNEIINQILPIILAALVSVIVVVIKGVGDVTIKFIAVKKDEAIARLGETEYRKRISAARDIWGIVDEHFRIYDTGASIFNTKAAMFNHLLLEKIPGLKQSDLDYLRQTIAGEINKGKDIIVPEMVVYEGGPV